MKKLLIYLIYLLVFIVAISCGKITPKGTIEVNTVALEKFNNIEASGKFRFFIVNSQKDFLEIETYPNIYKNLKIDVHNQTLSIKENRKIASVDFYDITLYTNTKINKISLNDSIEFNVSGVINTDELSVLLKNNAKFIGSIKTKRTNVEMWNTSRANFRGFTENASIKVADTANLIAPYWILDNAKIQSKNGSYTEINVKDSITGNVQNSAKLLYYNDPIRAFKTEKTATVNNKKLE